MSESSSLLSLKLGGVTMADATQLMRAMAFYMANPGISHYRQSIERLLSELRLISQENDDSIAQHLGVIIPQHSLAELIVMTNEEKRKLTTALNQIEERLRYARTYYLRLGRWPIFDGRPLPSHDMIMIVM